MTELILEHQCRLNALTLTAETLVDDLALAIGEDARFDTRGKNGIALFDNSGISSLFHTLTRRVLEVKFSLWGKQKPYLPRNRYSGDVSFRGKRLRDGGLEFLGELSFYDFPPLGVTAMPSECYTLSLQRDLNSNPDSCELEALAIGFDVDYVKSWIKQ